MFQIKSLLVFIVSLLKKIFSVEETGLKFQENFSPLNVFKTLAKNNEKIENESKAIGEEIIKRLIEIGLESKPCHQDLYHANFVYLKEKAYLIDWEYSSQGDPIFDYADLIWQNELEEDQDSINDIYKIIIHYNIYLILYYLLRNHKFLF